MTTLRTYSPHAIFILGLALFAAAPVALFHSRDARAASPSCPPGSVMLQGYAWAGFDVPGSPSYQSGPGWISFSGNANGNTSDPSYQVCENTTTGALSGYAWSSAFGHTGSNGWIDFGGLTADASHPAPTVNLSTGAVTGWARACAAFATPNSCSGALNTGTGATTPTDTRWDGWISLSSTNPGAAPTNGSSYGFVQSPNCATGWSGYAWGSADIGWISASGTATDGSSYGVKCGTPPTPITVSCSVSPDNGVIGSSPTTFTWTASASGGFDTNYTYKWSGDTDPASSPAITTAPVNYLKTYYTTTGTKNVSVTVTDGGGSSSGTPVYCVNSTGTGSPTSPGSGTGVGAYNQPTATLYANGSSTGATIVAGQSATLTWKSSYANSCDFVGPPPPTTSGAANNLSPGVSTGPLSSTQNYQISCKNVGGSAYSNIITVTVIQPNITIGANPTRVASGGTSTITWSSTNTTSCTITSSNASDTNFPITDNTANSSGSKVSGPIKGQTIFTATCQTKGSPVSNKVIVNILPVFQQF